MDVSFINPFIASTVSTFRSMLSAEISFLPPQLKSQVVPTYDISGIIGLSGLAQGVIALGFADPVAQSVVSRFVGGGTVYKSDLTDGIGEIVNIVAGYAKKDLTKFELSISLPNVILGKDHRVTTPSGVPAIVVPFESPFGRFNMEVALHTP